MRHTFLSLALVGLALGTLLPAPGARARQDAPPADAPAPASARQADPSRGGTAVVATGAATVVAVDPENRMVLLRTADGNMIPIKCGKDVKHLDQIKAGDEVKAVAMGRVALFVGKDAPPDDGAGRVVMRTTQDGKPVLVIVDTTQTKEKVDAVDPAGKTLTLQGDEGTPIKMAVGPDVDLSGIEKGDEVAKLKTGDDVSARVTEAMAIVVEKPDQQQQQQQQQQK